MSGDLMHKGLMELCEATADTVTLEDYIPIYQKRTLQVMKIKVGALIDAMVKLYDLSLEGAMPVQETPEETVEVEAEAPVEIVEEEIKKPTKTRGKNKTKKENE